MNTDPNSVWPPDQREQIWLEPTVRTIRFADHEAYHKELRACVLTQAKNPRFAKVYDPNSGIGSVKIFDQPAWGCPAASLIHERALTLFRRTMNSESVNAANERCRRRRE